MEIFRNKISNEELQLLPRAAFGGHIVVVDTESKMIEACKFLSRQSIIGFDTETRPAFKAGIVNKVALLQLSAPNHCYLFRLCMMKFDSPIIKILEDHNIIKVGAAILNDIKGLQSLRHFRPHAFVDLQSIAPEWHIEEKSVKKLSGLILGQRVSKAQRLSNWEATVLTPAQKGYAATDAWVCLEIYNKLLVTPKPQNI